jgi:hypothetical protein
MPPRFHFLATLIGAVSLGCTSQSPSAQTATPFSSTSENPIQVMELIAPKTSQSTVTISTQPAADELEVPVGTCDFMTEGSLGFSNQSPNEPDSVVLIGKSDANLPIVAERWGPTSGLQVLVVGQVHGDECAPAFVVNELRQRPPEILDCG